MRFLEGLGPVPPVLGLAVSGGGDSMALLVMAIEAGLTCRVVTVEHGLRPEAATEAEDVARFCAHRGIPHSTLTWRWDGTGNLSDAARRGRRALIAGWARQNGIADVALGHTRDDVAETFLMRLARGAGLDGLSAMRARWTEHGIAWHRPLLDMGREELRDILKARRIGWAEDPSNFDPKYERARTRAAMADLPLGLTPARLADVAGHLAEARRALDMATRQAAHDRSRVEGGDILIRTAGLDPEILRRLVCEAILWLRGAGYAPRGAALRRAIDQALAGQRAQLQGCGMVAQETELRLYREWQAVRDICVPVGQVWDGWQVQGDAPSGSMVRALGAEGLRQCADWRAAGLPRASLIASPSVWAKGVLIAAPLVKNTGEWRATRAAWPMMPLSH
nr:tRNA lysidine(34) synthetase TilS [Falsirhodobacter sp. alg1]